MELLLTATTDPSTSRASTVFFLMVFFALVIATLVAGSIHSETRRNALAAKRPRPAGPHEDEATTERARATIGSSIN